MRRRHVFGLAMVAIVFCRAAAYAGDSAPPSQGKIRLNVLFVGHSGTPRYKEFAELLDKHFAKVGQGDLAKFRQQNVQGYDVVVMDYDELKIVNDRIVSPKVPFDAAYSRPTVTIGATAGFLCSALKLKTGYL